MSYDPPLNRELIQRTVGYHGKPLQKIWESELPPYELQKLGIDDGLDFVVYMARQKHFTLQERAKRLKLQQFIVRNANALYRHYPSAATGPGLVMDYKASNLFAVPPMDAFLDTEPAESITHLLETVQPGDVVYGSVTMYKHYAGLLFRPIFVVGSVTSYVRNKSIKGTIAKNDLITPDKMSIAAKGFVANDLICCEVIDVHPDVRRINCSMQRSANSRAPETIKYGLLNKDDMPDIYNITLKRKDQTYEQFVESSPSFNDPAYIEQLYRSVGLDSNEYCTNMSSLKGRYPSQEYAAELRNSQNSKWAFRSVAQGIEHFKEGRHAEAFQCLNKALSMDPRNVEGLVARGALYANSGSFKKAVEDFEAALKLNPSHANARKYMGETLVALGRSYEEENRFEEAKKAYQDCLNIIPHHEEAQTSLDFLKSKPFIGKQIVEPTELELPSLNIVKPSASDRNKQEPDTSGVGGSGLFGGGGSSSSKRDNNESSRKDRKKDSKKDRKKRHHKKHHSSSSDSSTASSDSSDSSSDSSSSSSSASSTSSDSSSSRNKKRKRSKNDKKPKSVSPPIGKRMNAAAGGFGGPAPGELVGYPIGGQGGSVFGGHGSGHGQSGMDDYEQKVRKFLEMPRDEENYEEKVRRFVAEANKYQKERKQQEDKSKKKKKKDEKKAKKESKKKRKSDEKKKSKKRDKGGDDDGASGKDKLREALKIFENFPVLDELGSKLSVGGSVAEALSALLSAGSGGGPSAGTSRAKPSDLLDLDRGGPTAASGMDESGKDGKWRMMFNKDKRPTKEAAPMITSLSAGLSQHPFSNESDDESIGGGGGGPSYGAPSKPLQHNERSTIAGGGGGGGSRFGARYDDRDKGKFPTSTTTSQMPPVKSGPVVLDKFGNFRLATADAPSTAGSKPPEPSAAPPMRRSRSKSRTRTYGSSRSRSRSRSERRRSRSGSFRRSSRRFSRSRSRSFSRSRSGSYSRSRSRSRSFERRRFDRRIYRGGRGGGGGGYGGGGDRMGPFGGNRFNNSRGHYRRGGFRDFRDNRYGGGRGGGGGGGISGGGRDRPPFRPRYRGRYQRSYSRSMSKSPDRRPSSPGDDRPRHHNRRGDSRDRGDSRAGRDQHHSRERSPHPARRGSSRADSRDNQRDRDDSRDRDHHRRSEGRESSKRSKEDLNAAAGGSTGAPAGRGDEATNNSSPEASRAEKSRQRRSSSAGSQRSASGGSAKIPHDIEGRWADDDTERKKDRRVQEGEESTMAETAGTHSNSSAGAAAPSSTAVAGDVSLEELEKMLTKARKERKEEMLERNKDLLKKPAGGGF
ncbi:tetratricopeptide repeat protein 14 [Anopheles stephensi]|uniref:tetratricopeptide repeat protein 14 n=1 Tax=Anopheles stephensi TaxID=30069 RepID=UPI001658B259|nr:tetratricopeptide repeat protein 14 [Anopheles stephensi]